MVQKLPKAQRAEHTRMAILSAARDRFSTFGYEGTTIRTVAADASIDASMVMRYFGSKEGLFAAATEVNLALFDFSQVPQTELGVTVARHFLSRWEDEASGAPLRVLLSSSLAGSTASGKMQETFRTQLAPVLTAASIASGQEARERAGLIATQVLGFALCRYVLRLPPIVQMSVETAVSWLGPTIQAYLDAPAPVLPEAASPVVSGFAVPGMQ